MLLTAYRGEPLSKQSSLLFFNRWPIPIIRWFINCVRRRGYAFYMYNGTNIQTHSFTNNMTDMSLVFVFLCDSHALHPVSALIIPFIRCQTVSNHGGEGIKPMRTQLYIHVFREELGPIWSILCPVSVVTATYWISMDWNHRLWFWKLSILIFLL